MEAIRDHFGNCEEKEILDKAKEHFDEITDQIGDELIRKTTGSGTRKEQAKKEEAITKRTWMISTYVAWTISMSYISKAMPRFYK